MYLCVYIRMYIYIYMYMYIYIFIDLLLNLLCISFDIEFRATSPFFLQSQTRPPPISY